MFATEYETWRGQIITNIRPTSFSIAVFRHVAPWSLVETDRRFRGAYCLNHTGPLVLMMEAVSISETSVSFYQTTQSNIPEDSYLQAYIPSLDLVLTVCELRNSGSYAGWWVTSCCETEKEIYTLVKNVMLLSILKKMTFLTIVLFSKR
jgi:hypothetical protein